MSRWNLWVAAASLVAMGVVGCAHCDLCDDLPIPCNGPNCGGPPPAFAGPSYGGPAMMGGPDGSAVAPNPETMPNDAPPNLSSQPSGSADPAPPVAPRQPVGVGRP